jgi:hypothetical protein
MMAAMQRCMSCWARGPKPGETDLSRAAISEEEEVIKRRSKSG